MATAEPGETSKTGRRKGHLVILLGVLLALTIGYLFKEFVADPGIPGDNRTRAEVAAYEARVLPTRDQVLGYLDGQAIAETDAQGRAIANPRSLGLSRAAIHHLAIRRDRGDVFFTSATFTLDAGDGSYDVDLVINHNPTDGTFAFRNLQVREAARR